MLRITTLIFSLLFICTVNSQAQTRFIDAMFEVGTDTTVVYAQNIDVFTAGLGMPVNQLEMDVYQPQDDTLSLRPVVVFFPTGNFLIQYLNQGPFGSRRDSAIVEMIDQVVSRGYVGMSAEYRTGWLPTAPDQDTRTSTLLQAAYRGGQDAHALARYLRKSVAEDGNPFGIDTSRIVFFGLGTGGYVTNTHAFLDRVDEILADDRFYDENDRPYVVENFFSNPQGTTSTMAPNPSDPTMMVQSNLPNNVGYSSNVAMSVNANGALGDLDWMEGKDHEPMILGFHSPSDPFAPFSVGTVVVPTTQEIVVSGVAGTEQIIEKANMLGLNDALDPANAVDLPEIFSDLSEAVNQRNAAYQQVVVDPDPDNNTGAVEFELSHDNMYPFVYPGDTLASPYNWIDPVKVRAEITGFNAAFGQMVNADFVIGGELRFNPNATDAAAARTVIDTMMAFFLPRAYIGMNLSELDPSGTEDVVSNAAVGLNLYPNPAVGNFTVETEDGFPIRQINIFDVNGRVVAEIPGVNRTRYTINRGNLPNGQYVLQLRFDQGTTARKLFLR